MGNNLESEQQDWGTTLWLFLQPHFQRLVFLLIGSHRLPLGLADDDPVPLGGLAAVLLVSSLPVILSTLPAHPVACYPLKLRKL